MNRAIFNDKTTLEKLSRGGLFKIAEEAKYTVIEGEKQSDIYTVTPSDGHAFIRIGGDTGIDAADLITGNLIAFEEDYQVYQCRSVKLMNA